MAPTRQRPALRRRALLRPTISSLPHRTPATATHPAEEELWAVAVTEVGRDSDREATALEPALEGMEDRAEAVTQADQAAEEVTESVQAPEVPMEQQDRVEVMLFRFRHFNFVLMDFSLLGGGVYGGAGIGGGGSYGAGGLGGGGAYGVPQEPSYTVAYPAVSSTPSKGDTLSFLSSLAPSLLLSSLLLPLALALLTNATGVLNGRKKRDTFGDDYDDEQFSLNLDELNDDDIMANDAHFFHTSDAVVHSYDDAVGEPDKLAEFFKDRGLFNPLNPCLEKLACLSATSSKFKGSDKLKKYLFLIKNFKDCC